MTTKSLICKRMKGTKIMKMIKTVFTVLIYLAMLLLVCIFFTGNGAFIYEGF